MTTHIDPGAETYRCPACDGVLAAVDGLWGCTVCPYVPWHSAD